MIEIKPGSTALRSESIEVYTGLPVIAIDENVLNLMPGDTS